MRIRGRIQQESYTEIQEVQATFSSPLIYIIGDSQEKSREGILSEKNFAFGFVLSAALSSKFSSSFAKASQNVEQLSEHMAKMQEKAARLKSAFDSGIINEKTFKTAQAIQGQKTIRAYGEAAKGAFNEAAASAGALYYKAQVVSSIFTAPVQAAMKFESSMADVKKVVDFDTPEQFKEMSRDVLELSKRIPMTADALAQIVASGGQSGIDKQDLTAFAESAAKRKTNDN